MRGQLTDNIKNRKEKVRIREIVANIGVDTIKLLTRSFKADRGVRGGGIEQNCNGAIESGVRAEIKVSDLRIGLREEMDLNPTIISWPRGVNTP